MIKRVYYLMILGIFCSKSLYVAASNLPTTQTEVKTNSVAQGQHKKFVIPFEAPQGFFTAYTVIASLIGVCLIGLSIGLGYSYWYGSLGRYMQNRISANFLRLLAGSFTVIVAIYLMINSLTFLTAAYFFAFYKDQVILKENSMVIPVYLTMIDFKLYPLQKLLSMGKRVEIPYKSIVELKKIKHEDSHYTQPVIVLNSDIELETPYLYLPPSLISKKNLKKIFQVLKKK